MNTSFRRAGCLGWVKDTSETLTRLPKGSPQGALSRWRAFSQLIQAFITTHNYSQETDGLPQLDHLRRVYLQRQWGGWLAQQTVQWLEQGALRAQEGGLGEAGGGVIPGASQVDETSPLLLCLTGTIQWYSGSSQRPGSGDWVSLSATGR